MLPVTVRNPFYLFNDYLFDNLYSALRARAYFYEGSTFLCLPIPDRAHSGRKQIFNILSV